MSFDIAITADAAVANLNDATMIEIGPRSNYEIERIRLQAYAWAKRTGRTVTTSTERDARNPYMSVLRVRLVGSDAA